MPATPQANTSKPAFSKKRKPDTADSSRPMKQSKIDGFFPKRNLGSSDLGGSERRLVVLDDEQERVLKMVIDEGKNVFFTGAAGKGFLYITSLLRSHHLFGISWRPGTGKSHLLRAIIASLRDKHAKKPAVVSITASTGMAASNIGGMLFSLPCSSHFPSSVILCRCGFLTLWSRIRQV